MLPNVALGTYNADINGSVLRFEGGKTLNKHPKVIVFLLFIINIIFVWVSLMISDLFVSLERLSELNGYMLTDEGEIVSFLMFSIPMLLIQVLLLYFILKYLKKKHVHKSVIILNIVANSLLFLWFVFNLYDFTINGY